MFCDLVGSTALAARLDPEDMREIIAAYHKCCASLIERNGGFVAKYMGDGVLAYFGYPQAHEHDAERAVRAGLAIVEAAPKLETAAGAPLHVRVGIATGIVVVGDLLGSGESQERGVVGDTPNLAARLQGIAEPDSVVIAEGTRKLLGDLFELADLGPQELKGVAGPTRAYAALRESAQESRFEALHAGGLTALVGREEESELLLRRWAKAKAGEGQVVLLSGEAGIGKSRLAAALLERLAGEPHVRMRYFCSPQHTDSALYPIIGHMERAAGLAREDDAKSEARQARRAARTVRDLARGRRAYRRDAVAAERRPLSRARTRPSAAPAEDARGADRPDRGDRAPVSGADDLRGCALGRSFEPGSIRSARGQDRRAQGSAVRDVPAGVHRALDRASARDGAHDQSADAPRGEALIDSVAGNKTLPRTFRQDIVERADGIPSVRRGDDEGGARGRGRGRGGADDRVRPLAGARRARQPACLADGAARPAGSGQGGGADRRGDRAGVFPCAARPSWRACPSTELGSALDRLVQSGLLSRQGTPPHATYLFKHALVQDAAYGTLLREPRRALHARIAEVLESQFPDIAESQPELLARHCAEAGLIEKAARPVGQGGPAVARALGADGGRGPAHPRARTDCGVARNAALRREQIKLQVALANAQCNQRICRARDQSGRGAGAQLYRTSGSAGGASRRSLGAVFGPLRLLGSQLCRLQRRPVRELAAQFLASPRSKGRPSR